MITIINIVVIHDNPKAMGFVVEQLAKICRVYLNATRSNVAITFENK